LNAVKEILEDVFLDVEILILKRIKFIGFIRKYSRKLNSNVQMVAKKL
jgi:hypothetical protein